MRTLAAAAFAALLLLATTAGGLVATDLPTTIDIVVTANGVPVRAGQTVSGVVKGAITIHHGIGKHVQTYGNFLTLPFIEQGHSPDTDAWTHTVDIDTRRFYDGENLISVHAHPHNVDPSQPYTTDFTYATLMLVTANANPSPAHDVHLPTLSPAGSDFVPALDPNLGWTISGDVLVSDDTAANQQVDQSLSGSPVQVIAHLGDSVLGRFRWSTLQPPFGQFGLVSGTSLRPFQQAQPFTARIVLFACNGSGRANYGVRTFTMPALAPGDRAAMPLPTLDAKVLGVGNAGTIRVPDDGSYPLQVQVSNPVPTSARYDAMTTWVGNHVVAVTPLQPYIDALAPGATSFVVTVPIPGATIAQIQSAHAGGEAATAFALWNDFTSGFSDNLPASSHIHLNSVRTTSYPFPYGPPTAVIDSPVAGSSAIGATVAVAYAAYGTPTYRSARIQLDATAPVMVAATTGTWTFTGVARGAHTVTVTLLDANGVALPDATATAVTGFALVNDPTKAMSDHYQAVAGVTLQVPAATGVLANDHDLENDPRRAVLVAPPAHGALVLDPSGAFTYTATSHFEGVDTFTYQVDDTFSLSRTASVVLTVANPAIPASLLGDWVTVGRDATHAGYVKGRLGNRIPTLAWSRPLVPADGNLYLSGLAVAGATVYATGTSYFNQPQHVYALDAGSGATMWTTTLDLGYGISPPAYADGAVVAQWIDANEQGRIVALDGQTGATTWSTLFATQWATFQSPTPAAGNIYFESGAYSGLEGVSGATGAPLFTAFLEQFENWAPAYLDGHLYTFSANHLRDHDPATGVVRASLDYGTNAGNGWINGVNPIVQDGRAFVVVPGTYPDPPALHGVDLATMTTKWTVQDQFEGPPSVANGIVYALVSGALKAYDASTGALKATFTGPALILYQPVVTDDVVVVSGADATWILDRATLALRATLPSGGHPEIANDALYLFSTSSSVITCYDLVLPAPAANPQAIALDQDTSATITLSASGTPAATSYQIVAGPAHGTLSGSGAVRTYRPAAGYSGPDAFTFAASTGTTDSTVAVVAITVRHVNHAPVATPQTVKTHLQNTLAIVLTATDADHDALTYRIASGPAHGTLTGTAPALVYTPTGSFTGTDSFTFTASDGQAVSAPATVSVAVTIFAVKVNFQPAGAPVPPGYVVDSGLAYGTRSGLSFGWNALNDNTRDRNSATSPDQRYDTLDHMQLASNPNASWQMAVPRGTYQVHVVCGDPSNIDSNYRLNVEGVLAVDGRPTSGSHWLESAPSLQVVVTDGKLTISSASGAQNNKICFIEIIQVPTGSG